MVDNRIGVVVDARTTGNEQMAQHVQSLDKINAGWSQFNDLRREAAEQYPDDLKRQNVYIQQQLGLLKEIETVGSRERVKTLQDERSIIRERYAGRRMGTQAREEIATINRRIRNEETEHLQSRKEFVDARGHRMQWSADMGLGEPSQQDLLADLTGMGIRGAGPSGMAQMGLGRFARGVTGKMAGMGTAAKLGLGLGAGALAFGAYKLIGGLIEGKDAYKQIAPDLMNIAAMTGRLGGDATAFREEFEAIALLTGTTLKEMSQLEQSYIRITGNRAKGAALAGVVNLAQSFGIDKSLGVEFAGRMGMTGYAAETSSDRRLRTAIVEGVRSGIGEGRLPEFLQGVMGLTESVMRTSVTADSGLMGRYAGRLGALGTPFQGQRGVNQLTAFNQAITGGGMGFQAARRILEREKGAGNFSIGEVMAVQEQGLQDPRLLREFFTMAGEMGGRNPWNQAMLLNKWTGGAVKMKELYNPDEQINSWLEMQKLMGGKMRIGDMTQAEFDRVTRGLDITKENRAAMLELATPGGMEKRIKEMQATTGFEVNQRAIATEITKIEAAAFAFERANEFFLMGAKAIAEAALGSERAKELFAVPVPMTDMATFHRQVQSALPAAHPTKLDPDTHGGVVPR